MSLDVLPHTCTHLPSLSLPVCRDATEMEVVRHNIHHVPCRCGILTYYSAVYIIIITGCLRVTTNDKTPGPPSSAINEKTSCKSLSNYFPQSLLLDRYFRYATGQKIQPNRNNFDRIRINLIIYNNWNRLRSTEWFPCFYCLRRI